MDISIRDVMDYICIIIKILLPFFLIYNIHLIPCRNLFNLKRKIKNKVDVEGSICKTYIIKEISIFFSYYFKPHLRTKINCVLRHDNGREVLFTQSVN